MQANTAETAIEPKSDFEKFEALDEDQIVEELKGNVLDTYFYRLPNSTRIGISWAGIKHIARKMQEGGHPLSVEEAYITDSVDGKSYQARAKAVDLNTHEVRWGFSEQQKYIKKTNKRGDEWITDYEPIPFAFVLAGSKAQRNALRTFIPETAVVKGLKEWETKEATKKKDVPAGAKDVTPATTRPASPTDKLA